MQSISRKITPGQAQGVLLLLTLGVSYQIIYRNSSCRNPRTGQPCNTCNSPSQVSGAKNDL